MAFVPQLGDKCPYTRPSQPCILPLLEISRRLRAIREDSVGELAVRTNRLTRTFGPICAVSDLNLEVPAGALFGLIGPNGAGKSTVIRLLLGLLKPSSGHASVLGFDTVSEGDQIRAHAGALLESCALYDRLSAQDNLDFFGRIWHMSAPDRRARSRELLSRLSLWERRAEPVHAWSRDLRQRLCIARAIFHRPAIVFMDEPTSGLDPLAATAVHHDLADLAAAEGITVLLTTNDLAQAEALCTQVAVMHHGSLLAAGSMADICALGAQPRLEIVGRGFTDEVVALLSRRPEVASISRLDNGLALDLNGNVDTAPLVSLLVESSADVEEVKRNHMTLQSAFMALVQQSRHVERCP